MEFDAWDLEFPLEGVVDKAIKTDPLGLSLGPLHPATRAGIRLSLQLEGERIVDARAEIGFCHRGVEKETESRTWQQNVPLMTRINCFSAPLAEIGYCMAVENLLNIAIPERAMWIRMLYAEIARIADHLVAVSDVLIHCGMPDGTQQLMDERERLVRWFSRACGARIMTGASIVGGCTRDIQSAVLRVLPRLITDTLRAVDNVETLIAYNRLFADRTQGTGILSAEDVETWGITGPCARASGVAYDVRRAYPYYAYPDLEWDTPLGEVGDTYDRVHVRLEEIRQSAGLISQIIARLPRGPIQAQVPVGSGETYTSIEAANGEMNFFIMSNNGPGPYRCHIRTPSFLLAQAYPNIITGLTIGDAIVVLSSLHITGSEVDR